MKNTFSLPVRWFSHLLLIFILVSPFIFTAYIVSGNSMEPTLLHGDVLVVDRFSLKLFPPMRNQLIIFRNPHQKEITDIKRVIGLPGETVEITINSLIITYADGTNETFPGNTFFGGGVRGLNGLLFKMKLGKEDYFVLGDNREASRDSRFFGAVQPSDFIGRPVTELFPLSSFKLFP